MEEEHCAVSGGPRGENTVSCTYVGRISSSPSRIAFGRSSLLRRRCFITWRQERKRGNEGLRVSFLKKQIYIPSAVPTSDLYANASVPLFPLLPIVYLHHLPSLIPHSIIIISHSKPPSPSPSFGILLSYRFPPIHHFFLFFTTVKGR